MAGTIVGKIGQLAQSNPDKIALRFIGAPAESAISYRQLDMRAHSIAAGLENRGVEGGAVVLIVLATGIDLVASFLGAMIAGAIPSIMPPPSPKQLPEIYWAGHRKLFGVIEPGVIIADEANAEAYRAGLPEYANLLCTAEMAERAHTAHAPYLEPDDIAFVQHSSGTTALKKGVAISHRTAIAHLDHYADTLGFTSEDTIASWLPLYHDMGLAAGMLLPLLTGATVVMMDPFEWLVRPHLFLEAIDRFQATFCWLPNFAFDRMVAVASPSQRASLVSLKAVINCSEPCKRQSQEKFAARFASAGLSPTAVQVSYAMAENVFAVTQTPLGTTVRILRLKPSSLQTGLVAMAGDGEPAIEVVSCGRPLPRTSVRLVNQQRAAVDDGCMGEIVIKTPTLFGGYYRRPELTKAALVDGWYYTGDIGFMHADELYVVGRVDDLLIIRGRNFVAHELEQELAEIPGIKPGRMVAFSTASQKSGMQELAILFEPDGTAPEEIISRQIRDRLDAAANIVPQFVHCVRPGQLRKSSSGKISRAANRDWYESGLD